MRFLVSPFVALSVASGFAQSTASPSPAPVEVTPLNLPGSEPHVFRKVGTSDLRLHVVKPAGWTAGDRRACLVSFFGGGWSSGTPERSIAWAKWAAQQGLVGVAPDYRTRKRMNGTPEDCISDGRAAVRWVQENAADLGVDPARIVAMGASAGGHVAAWAAIPDQGPGADDPGAPNPLPVALILLNPVTDTKDGGYGGPKRFSGSAERALAASVPDKMPKEMPATLVFHGTADATVPYQNSVDFVQKMTANGNRCELITFEGLGHSYYSSKFGEAGAAAKSKTKDEMGKFLASMKLIESPTAGVAPASTGSYSE